MLLTILKSKLDTLEKTLANLESSIATRDVAWWIKAYEDEIAKIKIKINELEQNKGDYRHRS